MESRPTTTMNERVPQLTAGLCDQIASSTGPQDPIWTTSPIVQVLQAKAIKIKSRTVWRILISDGIHILQAIASTPKSNTLLENEHVRRGSIVRIQRMAAGPINDRRVMNIYDLELLVKETEKIGNPTPCTLDPPTSTSKPLSVEGHSEQRAPPSESGRSTLPIEGLNPYTNNWTIKARVTQKSEIIPWSNKNGKGKLFGVTLMDETGEIRGTGFNLTVDQLYDKFEEGKAYYISKARVNLAKKQFNNVANEYEISLEKNTEVEECPDQSSVPQVKYSFVRLDDLINKPRNSTCDVIAIVSQVGGVVPILTKTNRMVLKRELTLVDRSNSFTRLTLWGNQAKTYDDDGKNPVVAFKGVKIGEFQGPTLSMIDGSVMTINPNIPDAHELRGWYDSVVVNQGFTATSSAGFGSGGIFTFNRAEIRTIEDIGANLEITDAEKGALFSCRGTVLRFKDEDPAYPACPSRSCWKKVNDTGEGWHCGKCQKTWEKPEYRYLFSMVVSDATGQAWLQGYHDVGLAVFNMPADTLMKIKNNDPDRYPAVLSKSKYSTFNFSCRAKLDSYQGQSKMRYGISKILPLNYGEETAYLRDMIKANWAD